MFHILSSYSSFPFSNVTVVTTSESEQGRPEHFASNSKIFQYSRIIENNEPCNSINQRFLLTCSLLDTIFSKAASTLRRRNLKTQLYFYSFRRNIHPDPSRKGNFSKTLFKPEEIENAGFAFSCKHFEKGTFRKRWRHDIHVISLT